MNKDFYWWSAIIVTIMLLVTVLVINASYEIKKQEFCKNERIRPFPADFFSWKGIQDLGVEGLYQPKCI